jgi:alkylation response protein AidB-like acyl-CoA dehydrogenase
MVSFIPTDEQQLLIDTIRRYAVHDVQPIAHDADEDGKLPGDVVQKGWEIGLIPAVIPEDLGGFGDDLSAVTGVIAAEELAYGDLATAMSVMNPALMAYPLILYGTAEQRENLLPMFLEENSAPATAALLESGISFDAFNLKTTATIEGDKVRINGAKAYVPLAADAHWMLVYARDNISGNIDAYLVEDQIEGVQVERREQLMGLRALPTYRVNFNNATVDAACKLGGAVGMDYNRILNRQRVALAAMAVGVARSAFEYARDYAKQRIQFGKPIAQNQAIAFMLAESAIEIDGARLMAWEAAWKIDRGEDATREAVLAKQYADKAVLFVTDNAVQTLGGYGFIREYPAERWLRNGRGFPTFDGLAIV